MDALYGDSRPCEESALIDSDKVNPLMPTALYRCIPAHDKWLQSSNMGMVKWKVFCINVTYSHIYISPGNVAVRYWEPIKTVQTPHKHTHSALYLSIFLVIAALKYSPKPPGKTFLQKSDTLREITANPYETHRPRSELTFGFDGPVSEGCQLCFIVATAAVM